MEKLEKVEAVIDKCGVSYEEAKEALEACNYDMLDAIIYLERAGKVHRTSAHVETSSAQPAGPSQEMVQAQREYEQSSKQTKFGERVESFWDVVKRVLESGMDHKFVAERNGERILAVPVLIVVLTIILWAPMFPLFIVGLFFGFRYRIEGLAPVTVDINEAMGKAADGATQLKHDFVQEGKKQ